MKKENFGLKTRQVWKISLQINSTGSKIKNMKKIGGSIFRYNKYE